MPTPDDTTAYQIKEKLAELDAALLNKLPTMRSLLRTIHRSLKQNPDVVTILTEEECNTIVRSLSSITQNVITEATLKKPRKKALSKMTVDDL